MIELSIDDADGLSAMLGTVGGEVVRKAHGVVKKGAVNVKKAMQDDTRESDYFDKVGRFISFDQVGLSASIGPEKRGAGNLANIAYFGGARGGGGTVREPQRALEEEAPRFLRALLEVIEEATS